MSGEKTGNAISAEEAQDNPWTELMEDDSPDDEQSEEAEPQGKFYHASDIRRHVVNAQSIALGIKRATPDEVKFASVEGFIDQQSPERQAEMRRDFAKLELLRLDMDNTTGQDNHLEAYEDYIEKKGDIISRHLDEPDCVEYLMEVTGEPIEAVVNGMFIADSGRTLGHFDHISELLQENFGEEADQAAYNILQGAAIMGDISGENPGDFGMDELNDLFELGRQKDLELDSYMPVMFLQVAAKSEDAQDQENLVDNLEFLSDSGIEIKHVVEELCFDGKFATLLEHADRFAEYGIDVKSEVDDFVKNAIEEPKNNVGMVLQNPQAYQEYGVDVKWLLENNLPWVWHGKAKEMIRQKEDELREIGIELSQIESDSIALQAEIEMGYQEEFRDKMIPSRDLPAEVRSEWQGNVDKFLEEEDFDQTRVVLKQFLPEEWSQMERGEKEQAIQEFGAMIAESYHINHPYEIKIVPDSEIDPDNEDPGNSTYGTHKVNYRLARNPEMQECAKKLAAVGIEPVWLPQSEVKINEDGLSDGLETVDTVVHELRHAFQSEQSFLYRHGYYEHEQPTGDFEFLPHLAKYYAANLQAGNYCKSKDSYTEYRDQLVEADAFMFGERYQKVLKFIYEQPEPTEEEQKEKPKEEQESRNGLTRKAGRKLREWWQNKIRRKSGED